VRNVFRYRQTADEDYYWPSFIDIMASIVLVLFFFIVILVIRQFISVKTWDNELNEVMISLESSRRELDSINSELASKKMEMAGLEKILKEREAHIDNLSNQLTKDRQALAQKENELLEVQNQLEEISVLRLSLLSQVKASIEKELGQVIQSQNLIEIDSNANLVIQSSLLFDKGSSEISKNGKTMLKHFASAFYNILSDPHIRENIDSIIVSGYADSDDTYQNNYYLSCERAIAVINTMLGEIPGLANNYGSYFQASGFSEFRPLVKETDESSKSKNRRIQISVNIKDSHIREIIGEYMESR
jgi:chemotaxis protein MotB